MTTPLSPSDPSAILLERIAAALGPDYEIQRELGGGGMARVFVVRDNALRRLVAIKVFAPERSGSMSGERFGREILTVARLQHPNIVPLLRAGEVEGVPYFLMPFIEGASLRAAIGPGGMPVRNTVRILTDVVRALSYAHSAGVVHRDIKPDNILLSGETAVVTDFGVAKALSIALGTETRSTAPLTRTGMSFGTPVYMAPEQVAADPSADHRVDFYALGVTAYEMLCGTAPFHAETPQALLRAKLTMIPPTISLARTDVSPELEAIVMRCLAVDADHRPGSAAEILDALSDPAVMSTGAIALSGSTLRPRVDSGTSARKKVIAGVAAVAILTAGTAWIMLSKQSRHESTTTASAAAAPAAQVKPALDSHAITVIPFVDLAAASDTARFAVSLSESVRIALSAKPQLRVAASSTTLSALDSAGDVREAARRLGTAYVLTGSIDREGTSLRVSIQLLSADDGLSRWATTVDGDALHRFDFEKLVARTVAPLITTAILGDSAGATPPGAP